MDPFYRFALFAGWPIVRFLYRLRIRGIEHLPRTGGFVVAASHASNFDPWPLAVSTYPRQLRFLAKAELFNAALGPWLRRGGVIPVRRGAAEREVIQESVRLVRDAAQIVLVFPQGTRRRKGGCKRRPPRSHPGAASIALAAGAPLVPAAVVGTDRLLRFAAMQVAYGAPIRLDDLATFDARRAAREATRRLMDAIALLEASL